MIGVAIVGLIVGFGFGYGVRAMRAENERLDGWLAGFAAGVDLGDKDD